MKLLKVCIKFDLFIKSLLEPWHKSNLKVTDTAAQLCLCKTCLTHLDDIKGYVFIKNMDIFNPDECVRNKQLLKKIKKLFWMIHLNLNTNERYCANSADEIKERKENKL